MTENALIFEARLANIDQIVGDYFESSRERAMKAAATNRSPKRGVEKSLVGHNTTN